MYYVASSAGVATGPAAGFALVAVGGLALALAVGAALSLIVAGLVLALRTPPGKAVATSGGARLSSATRWPPRWRS